MYIYADDIQLYGAFKPMSSEGDISEEAEGLYQVAETLDDHELPQV